MPGWYGVGHVGLTPDGWRSTVRPSSEDARLLATGRPDLEAQSVPSYSVTLIQQGRQPFASLGPFPVTVTAGANSPPLPPARPAVRNEQREALLLPPERIGGYPGVLFFVVLVVLLYSVRRILGEGIIGD